MLTDEEKARIRQEEIFRQEVRRQLESKDAPKPASAEKSRLWTILNSSFTLWFLSTVVVAALTGAVTAYRSASAAETQKAETERRLVTEIGHRVFHAAEGLRVMEINVGRGTRYLPATVYRETIQTLNNDMSGQPGTRRDISIYPELRDRTLRSLMVELSTVADSSAQKDLREALVTTETFAALASERDVDASDTVDTATPPQESLAAIRNASRLVAAKLDRPRWHLAVLSRDTLE